MNFKLWLESFDKVSDFLLNPNHRHKTFEELLDEFKKDGGEVLGYGSNTAVYYHPNWDYIIKVFTRNECFLKFARFAYAHPHRAFPKFYGPPVRIVPFYTRYPAQTKIYVTRSERLYPVLDREKLKEINQGLAPIDAKELRNYPYKTYCFELIKKYPEAEILFDGLFVLNNHVKQCSFDYNKENIMQRKDGSLVLNDPLWEGSNPYMDFLRAQRAEIDDSDYYKDIPPPNVIGGKFPKRIKPVKPFKPVQPKMPDDEIPF